MIRLALSLSLWLLLALGLSGAVRVSYATLTTENDCPIFGGMPVCYVILFGYALITIAQFASMPVKSRLFWVGWLPVFLFAITGTTLEIGGGQTCPKTETGLPLCYVSLALIILIAILFSLLSNYPYTGVSKK